MAIKFEFGNKYFYIFGAVIASVLCILFYSVNFLVPLALAPFLIFAGAYAAMTKSGIEKEKWFTIMNSLYAYGLAAACVNILLFLLLFGPQLWNILFEINKYLAAVIGLSVFTLCLFVVSVFTYSLIGALAAFIRISLKK